LQLPDIQNEGSGDGLVNQAIAAVPDLITMRKKITINNKKATFAIKVLELKKFREAPYAARPPNLLKILLPSLPKLEKPFLILFIYIYYKE
tara:strand:+ start:175 stop:447 length:273 start_codon:yes stop_codon:yes gene_type:complete